MIRGDPYLETAASRPRAVLSSANSVRPRGGGGDKKGLGVWPGRGGGEPQIKGEGGGGGGGGGEWGVG